jgi:hypothetical protein
VIVRAYNWEPVHFKEASTMAIIGTDGYRESTKSRTRRLQKDAYDMASLMAAVEAVAEGERLGAARTKAARGALKRLLVPWGLIGSGNARYRTRLTHLTGTRLACEMKDDLHWPHHVRLIQSGRLGAIRWISIKNHPATSEAL